MAAGIVVILVLDVSVWLRALACGIWAVSGYRELRHLAAGFEQLRSIRLYANGAADVFDANGDCLSCRCAAGSVVLPKVAWLRLRSVDGQQFVEMLRGDVRRSHDWRRLQVIWRFIGTQQ